MQRTSVDDSLLEELAREHPDRPLVSLYLPVTSQPGELAKNRIRLKNATKEAVTQLKEVGLDERQAKAALEPLAEASTDELWSHPGRGIAVFLDTDEPRCLSLPNDVDEFVLAASHYHLKPLFAALPYQAPYYVLALSQNDVSVYSGDGLTLEKVSLHPDVPRSLADVVGREPSGRTLQHHAGDKGGADEQAIFHGHGAGSDDTDKEIERFLRETDEALREHLPNGSALILAGVEELLTRYRKITGYSAIVDEEIAGNVEHMSAEQLREEAWPIIEQRFERRRESTLRQLRERATDRPVTSELAEIVTAAADGRVARLFLASDVERWGSYDPESRRVETHEERNPGDNDLLDRAAVNAYLGGAEVYPLPGEQLPEDSFAIALLRY